MSIFKPTCGRCWTKPTHCMNHDWYDFDCWNCKQMLRAAAERDHKAWLLEQEAKAKWVSRRSH